jgi:hypothetical protein
MTDPQEPKPSLLDLALRVHRGELTPEQAAEILRGSKPPAPAEASA